MSVEALAAAPVVESVRSQLTYLGQGEGMPYTYLHEPPAGQPWENYSFEDRTVHIRDARGFALRPRLDLHGFELFDWPTSVGDFYDKDEVARSYYPEAMALALQATGGSRAIVFDHLVRRREPGRPNMNAFGRRADSRRPGPAGRVHNDYSEASGRKRLALVLGEQEALRWRGRYAIVNVWRSARGPVLDAPLALCTAGSVAPGDLVASEVRYADRTGEIYQVRYNAAHRWAFFSELQPHEAIVFKQFDSATGAARFTPHAAFEHPDTPPDAPPRESVELRCLVLF